MYGSLGSALVAGHLTVSMQKINWTIIQNTEYPKELQREVGITLLCAVNKTYAWDVQRHLHVFLLYL